MHINYQVDEKYNKKGLLISVAIHAVLLLGFFFIIVMTNPPADPLIQDGSGIPVNFGYDDFGMGDNNEQPSVEEAVVTPVQQEQQEEAAKQAEADQSEVITTEEETPYKVEEKKEKKTVKETKKVVEQPVKETKETKPAVTETKVTPKLDKRNSMGNGDKDRAGDQGSVNGTLDSKNYYGNGGTGNDPNGPGGGNGTGLNMSGWRWTSAPKVNDNSGESGKIVFKIVVDEEGTVLTATPVENQLSPAVTKVYKAALEKSKLEKTSNSNAAETSIGYVTFIIRAK